jgi:hypothetical protein
VDTEVEMVAFAFALFDNQRRFLGPVLRVNDFDHVELCHPAPPTESMPITAIAEVLRFQPAQHSQHRIKLRAVVTAALSNGRVALRDNQGQALIITGTSPTP